MIDLQWESVLTLKNAARIIPPRRAGRKTSTSCLYRWTSVGCRGVILESIQVGGTRCTSSEALARFFSQLSGTRTSKAGARKPTSTAHGANRIASSNNSRRKVCNRVAFKKAGPAEAILTNGSTVPA